MHARKTARDALFPSREDDAFFAPQRGDITLPDGTAARRFADRVNQGENRSGESEVRAAELAAMVLVHEVLHVVTAKYREQHPDTFARLAAQLDASLGPAAKKVLLDFVATFPPPTVYRGQRGEGDDTPWKYLERNGKEGETAIREEVLLLWVTNQNPAYDSVRTIVGDQELGPAYKAFVTEARTFFASEPSFGPGGETLVDLLLAPGRAHPTSIFAQLEYVDQSWAEPFGLDELPIWRRMALAHDLRTEEGKWFMRGGPGPGEPLLEAMRFGRRADAEPARFSRDLNWMPNLVLIAKSVYVWLDQLSKKYGRDIWRLDQVPDEELDQLASRGLTGLWLIGLFERSRASRRVKQMRGDSDALASAYSLKKYDIAHELGGFDAYENLKARAWVRGIRLAADMVPNHVGIDADWVIHHPDWFLQAPLPPYPNYRFGGPDLSDDSRIGVFLEEGYWNKTDAAVVFRRHDRWTGENRYIYHGNDGTSMPWNDTAQLDYLRADVRKAVIETILHVARMFPIIRFDAAMTLAKRHIQRLWFPLPGEGGAIPSRSDYAMTQDEFDRLIPVEFWREVVDTVAERAPDTLLLAEAFWMMEGYFVRTLGMHRVYNSAFMNMLKREENDKYRATIKNVLDFDAEILKRFVNFMNNPDEETAIAQFGAGDKYFGVCVLMSTMPGLPMFGHGQIEGLGEKYGMEYRRPREGEQPNETLIQRHEREIFPLLHRRHLFSGVDQFALYDFIVDRAVDEDVFAYSNGAGGERVLVLFNNRWKTTRGRIWQSTHRGNVAEELGLDPRRGEWLIIRDLPHELEYLRRTADVFAGGLEWELPAFKYHVLTGFRPVDATRSIPYDRLYAELGPHHGVPSIEAAARALHHRPIHAPLREACSKGHLTYLTLQLDVPPSDAVAPPAGAESEAPRAETPSAPPAGPPPSGETPSPPGVVVVSTPEAVAAAPIPKLGHEMAGRAALEERLGHVADGLEWVLSQEEARDITVPRDAIARAGDRFAALREVVRAPRAADVGSVLQIDLLLTWIQLESVLELLDAGIEAAAAPPPEVEPDTFDESSIVTETTPNGDIAIWVGALTPRSTKTSPAAASVPAPPSVRPTPTARPLSLPTREKLISDWDLAAPITQGLATTAPEPEARLRAALVLLAATLPSAPLADLLRHALLTRRGQVFMNVHEAGGSVWLIKERFEELARFLAEREAALGNIDFATATREVAAAIELAHHEGYRADRIAAKLRAPAFGHGSA